MAGKVYLVGAGPGDPELLTIKAKRLLGVADAVLHDELVNPEILQFVSPSARIENVGKRCGNHHISQDEIHARMISFARRGMTVVRLKGGDPSLFGRAGEEIEALCEAEVEFELVPGVTAAVAAAATSRIPLTDRRLGSNVLFLSNHHRLGKDETPVKNRIPEDTTVVVYMPGKNFGELSEKLTLGGMGPATPCLVVSCATRPEQVVHRSTVGDLARMTGLPAPALVIAGNVAKLYRAYGARKTYESLPAAVPTVTPG
jgi:uroporphyrin-III C-methyltransferase